MSAMWNEAGEPEAIWNGYTWLDTQAMMNTPDVEWIVPNFVARGYYTLLAGDPKTGKSSLPGILARKGEIGADWLGRPVEGAVWWHFTEEQDRQVKSRCQRSGITNIEGHYRVATRNQVPPAGFQRVETWSEVTHRIYSDYVQAPMLERPDVIVIDTLANWIDVTDMNDMAVATRISQDIIALKEILGNDIALLVLHQHNKGVSDDPVRSILGSQAFAANADLIVEIKRLRNNGGRISARGRAVDERFDEETEFTFHGDDYSVGHAQPIEDLWVVEYLQGEGGEFTTKELYEARQEAPGEAGTINAFRIKMKQLVDNGFIEVSGRRGREQLYRARGSGDD